MACNDKALSAVAVHRHISNGPFNNRQYDCFRLCACVGAESRESGKYLPVTAPEVSV